MLTRRSALKLIAAGMTGTLADACWIEPRLLSVTRAEVSSKSLPPSLDGLRIALLADFHFRPGKNDSLLEKIIARVHAEKPDLIMLPGDFMNGDPRVIDPLLGYLSKMSATHGIFASMGNHDGWKGNPSVIRQKFEAAGISFLINQHTLLSARGESLAIAATDFIWLGKPDPAKTLKGIAKETPILALVHEPDYFSTMAAQREILLQVSGHSHGGQCRIPLLGLAPITPKYAKNYIYGSYRLRESNLFVTCGIGLTGPQIRFACLPELAILTLRTPPKV